MSHELEKWLAASRLTNPGLQEIDGTTVDVDPELTIAYRSGGTSSVNRVKKKRKTVIVLEPYEKALPWPIRPPEVFPTTIIPPIVEAATKVLVGDLMNGGLNIPWSNGPVSLMHEEWPLGSLLFYTGRGVAISVGIFDSGDMMRDLTVSYHRRGVGLRVHTGIGRAAQRGVGQRQDPSLGGVVPAPVVPHNSLPPAKDDSRMLAPFFPQTPQQLEELGKGFDNPWMNRAPEMSPGDKFKANAGDLFKFFTGWATDPGSWIW